jgi:membrane protease YdiL (CAAX protease family)
MTAVVARRAGMGLYVVSGLATGAAAVGGWASIGAAVLASAIVLAAVRLVGEGEFMRSEAVAVAGLPVASVVVGSWLPWPVLVGACALAARVLRRDRHEPATSFGVPRTPAVMLAAAIALGVLSAVVLEIWLRARFSDGVEVTFPAVDAVRTWPLVAALGAVVALGAANALAEEWMWRGELLGSLRRRRSPAVAVCVQAASFGLAHLHGFPGGAQGIVLASLFGLATGSLAVRTGSLTLPVVAHLVPDCWMLLRTW